MEVSDNEVPGGNGERISESWIAGDKLIKLLECVPRTVAPQVHK
jgi:hypothetical protein